jgi:hypothetical protein
MGRPAAAMAGLLLVIAILFAVYFSSTQHHRTPAPHPTPTPTGIQLPTL